MFNAIENIGKRKIRKTTFAGIKPTLLDESAPFNQECADFAEMVRMRRLAWSSGYLSIRLQFTRP